MSEWIRTQEVRNFLRMRPEGVNRDTALFLECNLPTTWQRIIRLYGHERTFECLRRGDTEGAALRRLMK